MKKTLSICFFANGEYKFIINRGLDNCHSYSRKFSSYRVHEIEKLIAGKSVVDSFFGFNKIRYTFGFGVK